MNNREKRKTLTIIASTVVVVITAAMLISSVVTVPSVHAYKESKKFPHNHKKANKAEALKLDHSSKYKKCIEHRAKLGGSLENYEVDNCLHGKYE